MQFGPKPSYCGGKVQHVAGPSTWPEDDSQTEFSGLNCRVWRPVGSGAVAVAGSTHRFSHHVD
jgi:hypothetical protein